MKSNWLRKAFKGKLIVFTLIVIVISTIVFAIILFNLKSNLKSKETENIEPHDFFEYYVLVKVEGNNAPYTLYLPIPSNETVTSNLSNNTTDKTGHCIPTCTRVETLGIDPYTPINFSFVDTEYGRGLRLTSNASVFLFSYYKLWAVVEKPAFRFSMTNDSSVWIYLNRTDLTTKVSVSVLFVGEKTFFLERKYDIQAIVDGPLRTDIDCNNIQCYIEELLSENGTLELLEGWQEYTIASGEMYLPIS